MICHECGGSTKVLDSRSKDGSIRRKRTCTNCTTSFWTLEVLETSLHTEKDCTSEKNVSQTKTKAPPKTRMTNLSFSKLNNTSYMYDVDSLSDEELERQVMSGNVRFDEDEL